VAVTGARSEGSGGTGSLADETIRLLEALAAGHGRAAGAEGGGECRGCPACRLLTAARRVRPEAIERLLVAGEELLAAVREVASAFAAEPEPHPPGPSPEPPSPEPPVPGAAPREPASRAAPPRRVQRIELD